MHACKKGKLQLGSNIFPRAHLNYAKYWKYMYNSEIFFEISNKQSNENHRRDLVNSN